MIKVVSVFQQDGTQELNPLGYRVLRQSIEHDSDTAVRMLDLYTPSNWLKHVHHADVRW
jgi:hypothetical protein